MRYHPTMLTRAIPAKSGASSLSIELDMSRVEIYKLLNPEKYGFAARVFDTRDDLAKRIAKLCKVKESDVREYYLTVWRNTNGTSTAQ